MEEMKIPGFTWNKDKPSITLDTPPAKPKRITGTHFATVLGVDPWKTQFETWCKVTRTYEEPFEDNKYTIAGKVIEPKVFDFLRYSMGYGKRIVVPTDIYGADPFKSTYGNFYHDASKIFGGMWDAQITDSEGRLETIVEIKTVCTDGHAGSLDERWKDGKAPDYQALQACLYAYLSGVSDVMMVAVALKDGAGDYEHPENVVPSYANGNVYVDHFNIYDRYPNFSTYIDYAISWWKCYVLTGTSPEYSEKQDAEILKKLRENRPDMSEDTNLSAALAEMEELCIKIADMKADIKPLEDRLDKLKALVKKYAMGHFREGDTCVTLPGSKYNFQLTRALKASVDEESLKKAGLFEQYLKQTMRYTFYVKPKED